MRLSSLALLVVATACCLLEHYGVDAFVAGPSTTAQGRPSRSATTTALNAAALIIQNKGGGHGELGYQLALALKKNHQSLIDSITILQDDACKDGQEPFCSYATDLPDVEIIKAPLSDEGLTSDSLHQLLGAKTFDYVWDNASKKPEAGAGKACADLAKQYYNNLQLYAYVSSAGVYLDNGVFPMPETTPAKESAGQVQFENYCTDLGLPLVSFRPQYIYGTNANKHDYIDYYFDRLVRGLPIPIPGDGTQLVSLTNSQDVATLLASPLNNLDVAKEQRIFNCGTDKLYSYDQVADMCAKTAGVTDYNIEHFDGDLFGKANFPFRLTNFYVAPDQVNSKLNWQSEHDLANDLNWYYEGYKARGGPDKKMSLVKDWEICVGSKTTLPEYQSSIYDKYDPIIIDTSRVE